MLDLSPVPLESGVDIGFQGRSIIVGRVSEVIGPRPKIVPKVNRLRIVFYKYQQVNTIDLRAQRNPTMGVGLRFALKSVALSC